MLNTPPNCWQTSPTAQGSTAPPKVEKPKLYCGIQITKSLDAKIRYSSANEVQIFRDILFHEDTPDVPLPRMERNLPQSMNNLEPFQFARKLGALLREHVHFGEFRICVITIPGRDEAKAEQIQEQVEHLSIFNKVFCLTEASMYFSLLFDNGYDMGELYPFVIFSGSDSSFLKTVYNGRSLHFEENHGLFGAKFIATRSIECYLRRNEETPGHPSLTRFAKKVQNHFSCTPSRDLLIQWNDPRHDNKVYNFVQSLRPWNVEVESANDVEVETFNRVQEELVDLVFQECQFRVSNKKKIMRIVCLGELFVKMFKYFHLSTERGDVTINWHLCASEQLHIVEEAAYVYARVMDGGIGAMDSEEVKRKRGIKTFIGVNKNSYLVQDAKDVVFA